MEDDFGEFRKQLSAKFGLTNVTCFRVKGETFSELCHCVREVLADPFDSDTVLSPAFNTYSVTVGKLPFCKKRRDQGALRCEEPKAGACCSGKTKLLRFCVTSEQLNLRIESLVRGMEMKVREGQGYRLCTAAETFIALGVAQFKQSLSSQMLWIIKMAQQLKRKPNLTKSGAFLFDLCSYQMPEWQGIDFARALPYFNPTWPLHDRQEAEVEPGLIVSRIVWQGAKECPYQKAADKTYFGYHYGNHDLVFTRGPKQICLSSLTLHMILQHNDWNKGPYSVNPKALVEMLF